jgi:7-cyano-7-deazaguanine reductase
VHDDLPLGARVPLPEAYAPHALRGIARAAARAAIGIPGAPLPFAGEDVWNAHELSWLSARGQPRVAIGVLRVPCTSPRIVESKSLKLYLGSLHQERLGSASDVQRVVSEDVSRVVGTPVGLGLHSGRSPESSDSFAAAGVCLDELDVDVDRYDLAPELLFDAAAVASSAGPVRETLYSRTFRSLCPVTGQPDWARIRIAYDGRAIDRAALLRYLVSFRKHREFHESCVERIFWDLWRSWQPRALSVEGRFLRRGGLDIWPLRRSHDPRATVPGAQP